MFECGHKKKQQIYVMITFGRVLYITLLVRVCFVTGTTSVGSRTYHMPKKSFCS